MNHLIFRLTRAVLYYIILITFIPVPINSATPPNSELLNFSSNLPVIHILSESRIPDEERITTYMDVYDNSTGEVLALQNNTPNTLTISIELKGSTSADFSKKSYRFETWGSDLQDSNVNLLGLPAESDWVLYGPYSDKSLMRNALAHYLGSKMKPYSIRTKFCEVFLNHEYEGLYLLMEVAKRDKERIDISKLKTDDTSDMELTGGYVLMLDKIDREKSQNIFTSTQDAKYIIKYPKISSITSQQNEYIRTFLEDFEATFSLPNSEDLLQGYPSLMDIPSFVDLVLMNELSKDVDGYLFSTYLYKDKDSKNGKLHTGPFWDFNLAFGNADYRNGFDPEGWQLPTFHQLINEGSEPVPEHMNFWWHHLWKSPLFQRQLMRQWQEYRSDFLNTEHINNYIDSLFQLLDAAQERNFSKHRVLGQRLWPNYFVGRTWDEEIDWLKNWIENRLEWMDHQLEHEHQIQPISYVLTDMNNRVLDTLTNGFRIEVDSNIIPSFKIRVIANENTNILVELNKSTPDHQYYDDSSIFLNSDNLQFGHNYVQATPIISTDTTESLSIESLLYFYIIPSDSNSFLFPEHSPSSSSQDSSEFISSSSNDLAPIFSVDYNTQNFKLINHLQFWNGDYTLPANTNKVRIYNVSGGLELTVNERVPMESIRQHHFPPGIYLMHWE